MTSTIIKIKNNELETIAQNLQCLIARQSLNTNQIAEKLGLPLVTLRRLMLGSTTDPRISTLKNIAEYFDVSLDTLVSGDVSEFNLKKQSVRPQCVPILYWIDS